MSPMRIAFVMEQTLGHVTHAQNLHQVVQDRPDLAPVWLPIPFEAAGPARLLPYFRSNWSVRASWRARRALLNVEARQPLDALFFHTQVTSLFSYPFLQRHPSLISLDATPINYDSVAEYYGHQPAGSNPVDRLKYRLNQRALQAATWLVVWSDWARRSLMDDYAVDPEKIRVVAPGAAEAYFEVGEQRAARESTLVAGRPVRLLFVGGDFLRKGGPILLEALRGSLGERCELHLVTQADVPALPRVHVHRGIRPNSPELLRLFAEADVFVLPSHAECLAVALMEAAAAGLPIVTTDVAALPEAVRPGPSGILVRPGDVQGLRCALETLVADADVRRRFGRSAHEVARRKFHARRNNDLLIDLLIESVQTRRALGRAA